MMSKNFDIDLNFGQINESKVRDIFEGDGSIEVKTERGIWKKTGNIAVEISYRGNPSGISNTDAKWWIHVLNDDDAMDSAMIFDVDTLRKKIKDMIKSGDARVITAGDRLDSEIVLIPIDKLSITGVDNER